MGVTDVASCDGFVDRIADRRGQIEVHLRDERGQNVSRVRRPFLATAFVQPVERDRVELG
jgi:hypothetical protein